MTAARTSDPLKSRILAGVSSTSLATFIPQVVSLIGVMLILRWVAEGDFGVYALLIVIVQFFNILTELGVGVSVVRGLQGVSEPAERRTMIFTVITATFLFATSGAFLAIALKPWILRLYDYELLPSVFWYLLPLLILTSVNGMMQKILQGIYAYKGLLVVNILTAIVRFALVIAFVKFKGLGIRGIIFADAITGFLMLGFSLFFLPGRPKIVLDRVVLGRLLRFGLPLYLNGLLSYLFVKVDILMIGNMMDAQYVAAVDVAKRIPNNVSLLISASFISVFYPNISALLAQFDVEKARRLANMSMRLMTFALFAIAVGAAMLQDEIVLTLFSEKYLLVAPAFSILLMALATGMSGNIMGTTLVAGGHTKAPVYVNAVIICCNIIGNLILIPKMGFVGAALATLIVSALALPLNQWYLHRKMFHVDSWAYLGPMLIGLACWGSTQVWPIHSLGVRIALIVLYPTVCLTVLPGLRADLIGVLRHGRSMF